MIRAVVDANVLVSGLFWDKNPGFILTFHQQGRFKMLFTAETLDELRNVLSRPKFALRLQVVGPVFPITFPVQFNVPRSVE